MLFRSLGPLPQIRSRAFPIINRLVEIWFYFNNMEREKKGPKQNREILICEVGVGALWSSKLISSCFVWGAAFRLYLRSFFSQVAV